jgi:AraC-like DNA-binding protein
MHLSERSRVFETTHREATALPYHRHGIAFATIVLDGSYTEVRDGAPTSCPSGTIVLHHRCEVHADYFTSAGRCLNVELESAALDGILTSVDLDGDLRRAVSGVVQAFYADAPIPTLDGAVARLQTSLTRRVRRPEKHPPEWLQATIDRFEWTGGAPLREAARFAGVHHVHFSREFHRHIGMTPNEFRRRARLRRASDLLLTTSDRLVNVAQSCGFNDQSHLTRTFGSSLGLTPAAYRRAFAR